MKSLNTLNNLIVELNIINNLPLKNKTVSIKNDVKILNIKTSLKEAYCQLKLNHQQFKLKTIK